MKSDTVNAFISSFCLMIIMIAIFAVFLRTEHKFLEMQRQIEVNIEHIGMNQDHIDGIHEDGIQMIKFGGNQ